VSVQGARQLHNRFRAIHDTGRIYGHAWALATAQIARERVPVKTGETRRSIRIDHETATGAAVSAAGGAVFLEGGTRAHVEEAKGKALKFKQGGRPVYAKRVNKPATAKQPFLSRSSLEAADKESPAETLVDLWNGAA
jgi:hypothetical protein